MAHFGNIICVENGQLIHRNDTLFSGLVGKCRVIDRYRYSTKRYVWSAYWLPMQPGLHLLAEYRAPCLQWHQLQWHPGYSESFLNSQTTSNRNDLFTGTKVQNSLTVTLFLVPFNWEWGYEPGTAAGSENYCTFRPNVRLAGLGRKGARIGERNQRQTVRWRGWLRLLRITASTSSSLGQIYFRLGQVRVILLASNFFSAKLWVSHNHCTCTCILYGLWHKPYSDTVQW